MKSILIMLVCLAAPLVVQEQTPLQEMVKTEQAFSKMAQEKDTRDAFMAFIADDGLLFRPGAVNGKKWMLENPLPPSDKKPLLAWQPSYAETAESGDLGFTTGPWEFKNDIKDQKPSGYGHFVTVWKKQADGSWKFVVDLGISHPQPGGPQTIWQPGETPAKTTGKEVDSASALKALISRDLKYSDEGLKKGRVKAFLAYASPEVRLYVAGNLPFIGREAAANALTNARGQIKWRPSGGDVSQAGDLGYTHGTYELTDDAKTVTQRGSYVRIWKKQDGGWRIVMDVINAHEQ
jgi:ketosteroid isomerase-like protein